VAVWATAGVLHMINDVTPYALVGGAAAIAFVGGGAIAFDALRARGQTRPLLRSVPHAVLWSLAFAGSFWAAVMLSYLLGSLPVSDTRAGAFLAVASCGAFGGALASSLTLAVLPRK
jgi:hypothetical protein